ncbi:MAG: hypothetical protein CSA74_07905 [Rhodobacterales bacterium]|nr:MAG: hypothetical protein CSA74_07905 [Rhodobacterales bacterium]
MEFAWPAPLGPLAALATETPLRKMQDVRKVTPGHKAGDSNGNTTGHTGAEGDNAARTAEARDIVALRREMERRNLPAGPPPAFKMSLLEVESGIRHVLARIEAARTRTREAEALKAEATTRDRAAVAEMDRPMPPSGAAETTGPEAETRGATAPGAPTAPAGAAPAAIPGSDAVYGPRPGPGPGPGPRPDL